MQAEDFIVKKRLHAWTHTALGQSLITAQNEKLRELVPGLYGPIALQLGVRGFSSYLYLCEAVTHILATHSAAAETDEHGVELITTPEVLPFETKSIGVVLLPHVLEFSHDPHQILREVSRILVPDGHLVVIGFNPFSMWGARGLIHRILRNRRLIPWCGKYYRLSRVKDWLAVLGFEPVSGSMVYYRPPFLPVKFNLKLEMLDKIGARWCPMLAATYILVARKRELGFTAISPSWRKQRPVRTRLAEPVTRVLGRTHGAFGGLGH